MKYILVFVMFALLTVSCSKELDYLTDDFIPGEGEEVWVFFETQCADPWYKPAESYKLNDNEKVSAMIDYLIKEEIVVIKAKFQFDPSNAIACTACNCQTGGLFMVLINSDENVTAKLRNIGFSRY